MLRRQITAVVLAMLVTSMGLVSFAGSANAVADPGCYKVDPRTGVCIITIKDPGKPGSGGGGGGGGTGGGGGGSSIIKLVIDGQECTYAGLKDPQPPKSDPVWEGNSTGAIYACEVAPQVRAGSVIAGFQIPFWAASPPALQPPDPEVLARQALAAMNLKAINIGIAPDDAAGSVGVIGMPSWMWVEGPSPSTMGPITRTASARGYSVSATAKVSKVVWKMGDGTSVTCTGPGTPYADSYGKKSSPTCGHTYTRQGRYTVTATSYWTVSWAGIGQTGTIPVDFSTSTNITMGESQVINQ